MSLARVLTQGVATAAVIVLATSCTSTPSVDSVATPAVPTSATAPTSSSAQTAPPVTLTRPDARLDMSIAQVRGGVPASVRPRLSRALAQPIAGWIDGAFLTGDYPQGAFPGAFETWTVDAAGLAQRDRDVTTNAALGPDLVAVVADQQRVRLFVFAVGGTVGGATARVLLRMTAERQDGDTQDLEVSGQLYLTREANRWRIFGYDLRRSVSPQ